MSSEDILGICNPPGYQCPIVDKAIAKIRDIHKASNMAGNCDEIKDIRDYLSDIDWLDGDIEDLLEQLRAACEDIRYWGQQWKDLAKGLIEKYEPELLEEPNETT